MSSIQITARDASALGARSAAAVSSVSASGAAPARQDAPVHRAKLEARSLSKHYGNVIALAPLDLDVRAGELLTLLGPSGSGKTTLLQIICGLAEPTTGQLFIDGRDHTHSPPHRRDMGVVFQSYALFPHLTVRENVAFPLEMRRTPAATIRKKVADAFAMVGLADFGGRMPDQLSGGQQQRVALARCFVYEPALILMDEPLGALDRQLRETLQGEIRRLHRETGATIVFVTHDQEEALGLSDRICLMRDGHVEQIDTPAGIYDAPATEFAAGFIGLSNILPGVLTADGRIETADGLVPAGVLPGAVPHAGTRGVLVVRPESVVCVPSGEAALSGTVIEAVFAGAETRITCALQSGAQMIVRQGREAPPVAIGEPVHVSWPPEKARFLPDRR
ncbi:MAG: ABC transporter ATP-binding protein [Proteobacteria bacterium]|nr:ABC transporter ATP-binding protein [Pseudomonadota bacterium]